MNVRPRLFAVRRSCEFAATAAILLMVLSASIARAQSYADLYDFPGYPGPCCPQHPSILAEGRNGMLYGISSSGGSNNIGTVFSITPSGTFKVLYNFDTTHGSTPIGGLTLGTDGNLWGTTELGGANGFGTIFKITPAGALTVVYDFTGNTDGGYPVAALILGLDGQYYGTSHPGIAFKISPTGVFKALAKIPTESFGPLLLAHNGSLYGVTEFGGTNTDGTIYRVTGTTTTTLYNFDGPHGAFPIGGLAEASDGNLYGTTTAGGTDNAGVIFRITPTGTYTVVWNFSSAKNNAGYQAFAGLIAGSDGNLYGATIWGGLNGAGVIFRLTTAGAYTAIYNFDVPHGDGAYATPMQHTSGSIYGLVNRGGVVGNGVVYRFGAALPSFVSLSVPGSTVGQTIGIVGSGFATASSVTFNGTPASFHVLSNTYMTTTVPSGETGFVSVTTSSGTLFSNKIFKVAPRITGFSPTSGKVGDSITITGTGLIQASTIKVGTVRVLAYTVNSDGQLTFKVPPGAVSAKIAVTTPGGAATSAGVFTVTP